MTETTTTGERGESITTIRDGSKVATIHETGERFFVAMHIDHGPDGRTFCDSATYKTMRGAQRRARAFFA